MPCSLRGPKPLHSAQAQNDKEHCFELLAALIHLESTLITQFFKTRLSMSQRVQILRQHFAIHSSYCGKHTTTTNIIIRGHGSYVTMVSDTSNIPQNDRGMFKTDILKGCRVSRLEVVTLLFALHVVYPQQVGGLAKKIQWATYRCPKVSSTLSYSGSYSSSYGYSHSSRATCRSQLPISSLRGLLCTSSPPLRCTSSAETTSSGT